MSHSKQSRFTWICLTVSRTNQGLYSALSKTQIALKRTNQGEANTQMDIWLSIIDLILAWFSNLKPRPRFANIWPQCSDMGGEKIITVMYITTVSLLRYANLGYRCMRPWVTDSTVCLHCDGNWHAVICFVL